MTPPSVPFGARAPTIGAGLVAVLGTGLIVVPVALLDRDPAMAGVAAALAAAALVMLVSAGWIGPFGIVLATLALPAVIESDSLRITLAAPVTAMVAFGWFVGAVLRQRPLLPSGLPVRSAILLAMAFTIATLFAQHPFVSARELINLGVLGALLVLSVNVFEQTPEAMRQVSRAMVLVGSICGALAVLEGVGVIPGAFPRSGSGLYRAALGFGQPNALGLFLVVVFPFAVLEVSHRGRRWRWAAGLAVSCILGGLLFTFSRGSWLSVLAGMTALVLVGRWRWVLRAWLLAIVLLVIVDVGSGGLLRETVQRTIGDWVVEQRALLMLAGVSMFFAYPILGVGPGGFAESLDRVGAQIPALVDFKPTPHNAYVQVAAEVGIVGLAAYSLFIIAVLIPLIRAVRSPTDHDVDRKAFGYATVWSTASILAAGMVIWPLAHGAGQAVIFVIAMACAIPRMGRHS